MNLIIIAGIQIRCDEANRYCLNDLHRASGGVAKDRPAYWLENQQTKELMSEIEKAGIPAIQSKQGLGTFVVKEMVYAYAMWINAAFHLKVIRAYDALVTSSGPQLAVPKTFAESLRLAAEQAEQIEQQAAKIEAQKPAVEFVGRYVEAGGSKGFREVCKLLSAKEPEFRAFLVDTSVLYQLGGRLVPYQHHIDAGRFEIKAGVTHDDHAYAFNQTRFTPKGIEWVAGKWMAFRINKKEITA